MNMSLRSWVVLITALLGLATPAAPVLASCTVSAGTVITKANWRQYKDCFSSGIQAFWQGPISGKCPMMSRFMLATSILGRCTNGGTEMPLRRDACRNISTASSSTCGESFRLGDDVILSRVFVP
jgi:hypothetical protein